MDGFLGALTIKGKVNGLTEDLEKQRKTAADAAGFKLTGSDQLDEQNRCSPGMLQYIAYGLILIGGLGSIASIIFGASDVSKDLTTDIAFIATGVVVLLAMGYFCYYNKSNQAKVEFDDQQNNDVVKFPSVSNSSFQ